MPSAPADLEAAEDALRERPSPTDMLRRSFITGLAILLPLVVTLVLIAFVVNFISNILDPLVQVLQEAPVFGREDDLVLKLLAVAVFVALTISVGGYAQYGSGKGRLQRHFDDFMAAIPGIGSVYASFDEMSDLLLDSDTESFQDVKLVEYPVSNSYVVAFKTAETTDVVREATGHDDMETLFMPLAPNPVMGGFVIHVASERVYDVDLTVEEGIRSIVTSGVAIGDLETESEGLSSAQMQSLATTGEGETVEMPSTDTAATDTADSQDESTERLVPEGDHAGEDRCNGV